MLTAALLGLTLSVTIPPQATGEFNQACNKLVADKNAKPGASNEVCALSLIREGMRTLVKGSEQAAANQSVVDAVESLDGKFPEPLPLIICGDGVTDPGETCDDGNQVSGYGCSAGCQTE